MTGVNQRNVMTPRQYDLWLTRSQKFAMGFPFVMFTVFPLVFWFAFNSTGFQEVPASDLPPFFPAFPLLFFFGIGALYAWSVFSLPYRISVTHDQRIVFKSFLTSRSVRIAELLSIEPRSLHIQVGVSGYVLKHQGGKIRFPGQFTDQYMLIYELKHANPQLDIKGC